jgi:sulfate permease, SulP family
MTGRAQGFSFFDLYTPKLVTVLRERYGLKELRADAISGLTVAIVALPLSMAIAIASGVTPDRGLYTSIVGGFVVSAMGGSRFQIGGPAGAFIVLVYATVQSYGVDGLILATFLAGLLLLAIGLLRLGTFIKYIPYPVTVGFTAGIAVIIFASQIKDLLGLSLSGAEPGAFLPKLQALAAALPTFSAAAIGIALLAIVGIAVVRRFRPRWPSFLIAVVLTSVAAAVLNLPVETIGTRFGGIPQSLPLPHLPAFSVERVITLLPAAAAFALLGAIESLLSAVVADSMTGRRHRSNAELVAQGAANIASSLFGGFCVTGAIARTATNIRAGARGPVSGMLHSAFLLVFMLVAAPLASYIPLAALAGILAVVCWNMAEKHAFGVLLRASRGDAVVLLATFLIVVFKDLTTGILVGFGLGALLFLHRMAHAVHVAEDDRPDFVPGDSRQPYDPALATDRDVVVYRISGAFFFGAAAGVGATLDRIGAHPKTYVLDFSAVPIIDSTAAFTIAGFARKAQKQGAAVIIAGADASVHRMLTLHGVQQAQFQPSIAAALAAAPSSPGGR